jgi:hypothetical protein
MRSIYGVLRPHPKLNSFGGVFKRSTMVLVERLAAISALFQIRRTGAGIGLNHFEMLVPVPLQKRFRATA